MTYVHSEPQVTIIWNNCLFSEAVAKENSWVANDYGDDHFFVLGNKSTMVDQGGPARAIACNVNLTQILMTLQSGAAYHSLGFEDEDFGSSPSKDLF